MPEKTKILYADDVRETDTFHDPSVEVVTIANHEHIVDDLCDALRWREDAERGLVKLAGGSPEQSLLSAVTKLVEEVELYRQRRDESPVLSDTSIAVLDRVPTSMGPAGDWRDVGTARIPATAENVRAITHPDVDGLLFVTEDAWENYEDARRYNAPGGLLVGESRRESGGTLERRDDGLYFGLDGEDQKLIRAT